LNSAILVVNYHDPDKLPIGADFAQDYEQALRQAESTDYLVGFLKIDQASLKSAKLLLQIMSQKTTPCNFVIMADNLEERNCYQILNNFHINRFINSGFESEKVISFLLETLEKSQLAIQNSALKQTVQEQNEKLIEARSKLEAGIEKRQTYLEQSKRRLNILNNRVEALHKALLAVQQGTSIPQMERELTDALKTAFEIAWIRIVQATQKSLKSQFMKARTAASVFVTGLNQEHNSLGEVFFARAKENPFERSEKEFLRRVSDAIALAIDRIVKLEELENLEQQWEITFNAFSHPLALLDENYNIIQANNSYIEAAQLTKDSIRGTKCYESLLSRSEPCENCHLSESFELGEQKLKNDVLTDFRVQSFRIELQPVGVVYFNLYQDLKKKKALERRVLQNSKTVELGTIGGSIAHELNNPLGGILNYLQLILMDITSQHPLYDDIKEMEKGALRSKEIVQNLLSFTRKPSIETRDNFDLKQALVKAVKITELQTKSRGVKVDLSFGNDSIMIMGQQSLIVQAIRNILQNSYESIAEAKKQDSTKGHIKIRVHEVDNFVNIEIEDDGIGASQHDVRRFIDPLFTRKSPTNHPGLGLTLSYQIITEHQGDLILVPLKSGGLQARIALPKSDQTNT
jgi:two-component system NtrC family sensor kinase